MFVQVYIMTSPIAAQDGGPVYGGPLDSTVTVVVLIFDNAFSFLKMGYASAMSFVLFAIIAIVTVINSRLLRYDVGY